MDNRKRVTLALAAFNLGLTVIIGAFGAHGLESKVSAKAIKTFSTGVTYHQLHGLALLLLPLISYVTNRSFTWTARLFILGSILFSGFCYLYAITGVKSFAMVVPFGGLSFIAGWFTLSYALFKKEA